MYYLIILVLLFLAELFYFRIADKCNIIDKPNERSSHTRITLRGGGIIFYLGALTFFLTNQFEYPWFILALTLITFISFVDDIRSTSQGLRLVFHFTAMALLFYQWGLFSLPWWTLLVALIVCTGIINAYNFMDGINGIASVEAITTVVSMAILYYVLNTTLNSDILWLLAACVFGFLLWNFPKAKIFMGDACSGFLGLTLGILALIALKENLVLFCAWIICLGVFVVDATYTLIKRVLSGYKMYDAHRSHSYQILSRKCGSHTPVTLAVAAINLLWLFPIAYITVTQAWAYPELAVLIAYIPLLIVAIKFKAGHADA